MITISEKGDTTIRIATGGVKVEGGTQWTAYPYYDSDPTLQRFPHEQKKEIKELSITGFREKEDLSGHRMKKEVASAIARLLKNIERNKELGLKVHQIDVAPEGEVAKILETQYGISSIEKETSTPPETKG